MIDWLSHLHGLIAVETAAARLTIVTVDGPTPREIGATMLVGADAISGSTAPGGTIIGRIGRGALELAALECARGLLTEHSAGRATAAWRRQIVSVPTGPVLGSGSGGTISALVELFTAQEVAQLPRPDSARDVTLARPFTSGVPVISLRGSSSLDGLPSQVAASISDLRDTPWRMRAVLAPDEADGSAWFIETALPREVPFYVYGSGRFARAVVRAMADLPFELHWVDTDPARLHLERAIDVEPTAVAHPAEIAATAPRDSFHAVMTNSHELDFEICRSLLAHGRFGYAGVIGSQMKRERMHARFAAAGFSASAFERIACPIGLPAIKAKMPAALAVSVAAEALIAHEALMRAPSSQLATKL